MAALKIWIGAALAIALFLAIQVVLDQQAEQVERVAAVRRT
ncbi:hypothetical protein [Burkholderia multivorans]|nr:hypothetical protein [Burkholderia multivorans]